MRGRLILLAVLIFAYPGMARADVVEIQRLNFGKWYFPGNNSVYTISVALNGSYSNSPTLTMLQPPQVGIYDIGDLTPDTIINSIDVYQNGQLQSGGGNGFDVDNFTTSSSGATDHNGRVTVTLGGDLHTTGAGGGYPTGTYTGQIDLDFNLNF